MGEYFLWGYFNERPVYQHVSGLDFLYFHKNNVWGAGPKIGGNSAGLLNFGRNSCPYKLGKYPKSNIHVSTYKTTFLLKKKHAYKNTITYMYDVFW